MSDDRILSADEYERRIMASMFGTPESEVGVLIEHDRALRAAVLPSEGWEQVADDLAVAARRVDGAAPPEPERCPTCGARFRNKPWSGCQSPETPNPWHDAPASSTPTEVERLTQERESFRAARDFWMRQCAAYREALSNARPFMVSGAEMVGSPMALRRQEVLRQVDAALSGQQDTTEAHDG